jgi:hypothetical protein
MCSSIVVSTLNDIMYQYSIWVTALLPEWDRPFIWITIIKDAQQQQGGGGSSPAGQAMAKPLSSEEVQRSYSVLSAIPIPHPA